MIVIDWRKIGKLQFFFVLTKLMRSKGVMQYTHILKNNACTLFFYKKVINILLLKKSLSYMCLTESKIKISNTSFYPLSKYLFFQISFSLESSSILPWIIVPASSTIILRKCWDFLKTIPPFKHLQESV